MTGQPTIRGHLLTWAALLALTGATWGLAHVPLGPGNLAVALAIACAKGLLIALFFMQLVQPEFVHRAVLGVAVILVLLLVTIVLVESQTRFPLATPPGSARSRAPLTGQLD